MLSNNEFSEVLNSWSSMGKSIATATIEPKTHASSTQQIGQYERGKDPYLVFKNVPSTINVEILINICSAFGKVLRGRQHEQFNMYFVNFATINDLLNVLEGLKNSNNLFGMTIELGKTFLNQPTNPNPAVENQQTSERTQNRTVTFDTEQQRNSKDNNYNHINFIDLSYHAFNRNRKFLRITEKLSPNPVVMAICMTFFTTMEFVIVFSGFVTTLPSRWNA